MPSSHYPSLEAVNAADRMQICSWYRFLPSPGTWAIGTDQLEATLREEAEIMDRIAERFREFGGFTPQISKSIGFSPPTN